MNFKIMEMVEKVRVYKEIMATFEFLIGPVLLIILWLLLDKFVKKMFRHIFFVAGSRAEKRAKDEVYKRAVAYRMTTIRGFSTQIVRTILAFVMLFWLLSSIGIDLRPVIAGVGIVGLGLSLAAQNMIRDYLNGFIILIEDQYNVGDWVTLGAYSGTVERFALRATRLRDIEGNLVIIPNGTITAVTNFTKDWSIALVKIGITYESDYLKAKELALNLAKEMEDDPANVILEMPRFQGITDFADSSINMRVLMKTVPGQQWALARTYREKLKEIFDAEKISFAYPQIVVHEGDTKVKQLEKQI